MQKHFRHPSGFSLIEIMITVAIVGTLAIIAYPSYQQYIIRSKRADAMAAMQEAAGAMERHFTLNGSYEGAATGGSDTGTPAVFPAQSPPTGRKMYDLRITSATRSGFTLRATPYAGSIQKDDGIIEIDHSGAKRWDQDNDGSFGSDENDWRKN